MSFFFFILVTIASAVLVLIVLIQNPKGGGLSGTIAGFSNQFMGVKQTTDVLEKGTWLFAAVLGLLCIVSSLFFTGNTTNEDTKILKQINTSTTAPANNQAAPSSQPNTVTLPSTSKKK